MIVKREFLILLSLLLLIGPATAYYASSTSFAPSDPSTVWIIADTGQQNVIYLVATNATYGPVKNAQVSFTIDKPLLGTISPAIISTDNLGKANCTFTVNSTQPTSGTVTITATLVTTEDLTGATYHTNLTWQQKIDHNVPYNAVFTYPNQVALESIVPVQIAFFDRWGNVIDDKRPGPAHNVTLHVNGPSPPNNCGFTNYGLVHDQNLNLNSGGIVNVNITPATKPGWHYILMDPMGSIPEQMKLFNTVANGVPFNMTQSFSPDGSPYATVLADGTSRFTYYYTLTDKYGNPTQNQGILINATDGSQTLNYTMENGQVWSYFGPKSFTGLFTINATPVGNSSLALSKVVRFYNTSPQNIDVSANPQSMPSRDASPAIYSNISAKITDIMGNGVAGEVVTFTLHGVTDSPVSANETKNASFSSSSTVLTATAVSDVNGFATVKLYPAKFATTTEPGYNQQVTGTGTVTADWDGNQRDIQLTWKNYPYLSAVVAVNPQQVKVGDIVNVSIILTGDGWALVPPPADVVLVTDLSGSMGENMAPSGTKITNAKAALKQFVALSNGKVNIALASYGNSPSPSNEAMQLWNIQSANASAHPFNPYGSVTDRASTKPSNTGASDAMIDRDLTTSSTNLNTTIGNYNDQASTDIAGGLNAGLQELNTKGYPGHNQTIVLMTDGIANMAPINATFPLKSYQPSDYNGGTDTSVIAKTAAINIATNIKNQHIKIYTIGFGSDADTATLTAIASPGCYYTASDGTALAQVYTTIYGQVFTDASVNTVTSLDFGNLIVNNNPPAAGNYFSYIANTTAPGSTLLDKYNITPNGAINQHLSPGTDPVSGFPYGIGPIIINQSDYYNANNQQLQFNIGTIKVNDTWKTDFQLMALKEGNIQIFGPDSKICFTNGNAGNSCMALPNLSASISMNPLNLGVSQSTMTVVGLTRTDGGLTDLVKSTLPVTWTTNYNGKDLITEEVSYIHDNDPPVKFDVKTFDPTTGVIPPMASTLDMETLPSGGYTIQVHAYTNDATNTAEVGPFSYTTVGRSFIKLQ